MKTIASKPNLHYIDLKNPSTNYLSTAKFTPLNLTSVTQITEIKEGEGGDDINDKTRKRMEKYSEQKSKNMKRE